MKKRNEYRLDLLNWQQVRELVPDKIDTVILPLGTMEAHGATAIGTDSILAERISERMAEKMNVLVAPTLNYGITNSLLAYNGSTSLSNELYQDLIYEILEGLFRIGFDKIIIINGHGGQDEEVKEVVTEFSKDTEVKIILYHWWEYVAQIRNDVYGLESNLEGGHAGLEETAMMVALCPEGVQKHLYSEKLVYHPYPGVKVMPMPGTIFYSKELPPPDFDPERAGKFADAVVEHIISMSEDIISKWNI
ncbi:MAG: creatininase family protein [Acidobacteria bacterium]|nr:creatininase family protein [Acidobacteriota bacterium]